MKYVIWFIGLLAIVIFSIFGVILIRNTLRGFRSTQSANTTPAQVVRVSDQELTATTVEYIVDGPVVADEDYRSIRYVITSGQRTATVRKGYQAATLREQQLGNNLPAFTEFAAALDNAGFGTEQETRRRTTPAEASAGRCSNGRFYTMRILVNNEVKSDLWTSNCGNANSASFGGNRSAVDTLFRLQFPQHNELVDDIGGRF